MYLPNICSYFIHYLYKETIIIVLTINSRLSVGNMSKVGKPVLLKMTIPFPIALSLSCDPCIGHSYYTHIIVLYRNTQLGGCKCRYITII